MTGLKVEDSIRVVSDIHSECWDYETTDFVAMASMLVHSRKGDHKRTLVLAGDIGTVKKMKTLVALVTEFAKRFKQIIYVPGNHEGYGGDINSYVRIIKNGLSHLDNVFVLYRERHENFVGCTLWTDFNGGDLRSMHLAEVSMSDYFRIYDGGTTLRSSRILREHMEDMEFLRAEVKPGDIVVTHHAPTPRSIHPRYKGSDINFLFANDIGDFIRERNPAVWFHGHMHDPCSYRIKATRVVCNPFGYPFEAHKNGFEPDKVIQPGKYKVGKDLGFIPNPSLDLKSWDEQVPTDLSGG